MVINGVFMMNLHPLGKPMGPVGSAAQGPRRGGRRGL